MTPRGIWVHNATAEAFWLGKKDEEWVYRIVERLPGGGTSETMYQEL